MGLFFLLIIIASVFVLVRLFLYRTALIYYLKNWGYWIKDRLHVYQSFRVPQLNENNQENQFYRRVSTYVNSLSAIEDSDNINLFSGSGGCGGNNKKSNEILLCLDDDQTVQDTFLGARLFWTISVDRKSSRRSFVLKVKKRDKRRILQSYINHVQRVSEEIESRCKEVRLYMNTEPEDDRRNGRWRSVPFSHPSTIDTVAMDSDLKNKIKSDLEAFLKSKQYYHRLGRVWKRSYLLYGPSGTGKSSFIAAMAKFLSYDVYDVDLTKVSDDSDLKMLLLQTTSKSLIVVEDLDRFVMNNSAATSIGVSLSGILNFMDGIVNSCCGDEKVMVFTMNSKERIDPAILRPGRIDVHIHFPLCNFDSFKTLANNCLGLKDHKLFPQVEEKFQSGATMSPAEISEIMIVNRGSPTRALRSVITALQISGDAREAELSAAKHGRRLQYLDSTAGKSGRRSQVGDSGAEESGESSGVFGKETNVPVVKEIQKLYGLLRMKGSKKIEPSDYHSGLIER